MKTKHLVAISSCALPLVMSSESLAVYTGLSVELHSSVIAGGVPRDVYRVYANFDNPDDHLVWVAGSTLNGPLTIQSRNSDDSGPGTNFFNPGLGAGQVAPSSPGSPHYWGTYVTIGISNALQGDLQKGSPVDHTTISPGFPNFIAGNELVNSNLAWFTVGPQEQGSAGYLADEDFQLRVQIMQLSVNAGENVRGTVALGTVPDGYDEYQNFTVQTFNSIPAPGTLALLALGAGIRRRRRRTCRGFFV
jgi:hypothetical protein